MSEDKPFVFDVEAHELQRLLDEGADAAIIAERLRRLVHNRSAVTDIIAAHMDPAGDTREQIFIKRRGGVGRRPLPFSQISEIGEAVSVLVGQGKIVKEAIFEVHRTHGMEQRLVRRYHEIYERLMDDYYMAIDDDKK